MADRASPGTRRLTIELPRDLHDMVQECAGIAHKTVDRFIVDVLRHEVQRWDESFGRSSHG